MDAFMVIDQLGGWQQGDGFDMIDQQKQAIAQANAQAAAVGVAFDPANSVGTFGVYQPGAINWDATGAAVRSPNTGPVTVLPALIVTGSRSTLADDIDRAAYEAGYLPSLATNSEGRALTVVDVTNSAVGLGGEVATGTARELQAAGQFGLNGNIYKAGFYGNQAAGYSPAEVAAAKSAQATLATAGRVIVVGGAGVGLVLAGKDAYDSGFSKLGGRKAIR